MVVEGDFAVRTAKLTKVFRDFWMREKVTAVRELDLEIHSHEVFGLLGPNGSGKSTTLKMILGLLFPTRGRISVFGKHPTDVASKSRIGFLPEESYLYPFLNAWETLEFYGQLFHQPRRQRKRRIEMLLEMVGLTSVAYRRVGEYSKGMQRRIGLAQALINDPDLLILDEPTSGMDPIGTRQFKDLIKTLAMRGKTVLLSSHLLADVEDVCDRVSILYGGRQRACGPIDELLARSGLAQITTDRLDEVTLAKVKEILQAQPGEVLEVSTPRDKLEALFLRIVAEAQEQKLSTGGAIAGGQVAEFLREGAEPQEERPSDLIEQLVTVSAVEEVAEEAPEPAVSERVEPDKGVLDELVSSARSPEPQDQGEQAEQEEAAKKVEADRGVIDQLLGNNESSSQED